MARQTPILIKTFPAGSAISNANVCVVLDTSNAGNVKLPAAAAATDFVGVVTQPSSSGTSYSVAVMVAGVAQIKSDGSAAVNAGDYVTIADNTGAIKTVTPSFGGNTLAQVVGVALSTATNTAGLLVDVLLQPMLHKP